MTSPNVLLVVFDTARRETMEPYGAGVGSTPTIADLARRGHAFQHGYATSSWTLPSHASMFTGLLPRRLGLAQAPEGGMHLVGSVLGAHKDRMLTTVLAGAGYATRGFSTNLWVSAHAGFDIGFDELAYVDSGRHQAMEALTGEGPRAKLAWALEGARSRSDDGATEVAERLTASIGSWKGQPTFWFVNLTECHSPYLPPKPWNDLPAWERARAALDLQRNLSFLAICLYACGHHEISAEAFGRMGHLYERAVSYMDDWLGRVLDALERRGILDETLVILTSDHGENFGEQGLIAHGFSLDQRLTNVPLVMAGPGQPEADRLVSLAELPKIVATAAGVENSPYTSEDLPSGVAVSQYDPLAPLGHPKMRDFASRYGLTDDDLEPITAQMTAATDGPHKLVVRDGVESVYDLVADPGERAPLHGDELAAPLARLRAALDHPALQQAEATVAIAEGMAASPEDVEAIERQMKLLGYL